MVGNTFQQHRAGGWLPYWVGGAGATIVAIMGAEQAPTRAHALLADHRHVIVFAAPAEATPPEVAHRVGEAVAELGIGRFDLLAEGDGAMAALWLALDPHAEIGSIVLAGPAGVPDEAFRTTTPPVLMLIGTEDEPDAGDLWRAVQPQCNFMFAYGARRAIGTERPEALAFIALEFFERRDLFLVSRESGVILPTPGPYLIH
jgi:pimeloyl-ACP methyl ester carboxylesterase